MRAALFRHKQPGDLTLHPRRDQDRARLGQRLHPRGNVGDVAINLAARIEDGGTGFKADAGDELRLGRSGILAIELGQGALDRQRRACRALGVVLVRQRIAEQAHQPVAEFFRDVAAHFGDRGGSGVEIGADEVAPFLGIELRGDRGRADQIAEHDGEIAALTGGLGGWRKTIVTSRGPAPVLDAGRFLFTWVQGRLSGGSLTPTRQSPQASCVDDQAGRPSL